MSSQGTLLQKRQRATSGNSVDSFKKQIAKQNDMIEDAQISNTNRKLHQNIQDKDNEINHSLLFEPYRAFGYYTSDIPFCIFKSDQDILLATSVGGHAFYVYNTTKLNLVYMSRFIENEIIWIEASQDGFIYTALDDNSIVSWKKMHKTNQYIGHTKPIIKFLLASEFIFSLAQDGEFIIFNLKTGSVIKKLNYALKFNVMIHPTTYVNKLLFASDNKIELWNVIDDQKIYEFKNITEGKEHCKITQIVQTPVVHTAAVGFSDGEIRLVNLQYDQVLFSFHQTDGGVQSLAFSTDTTLGLSLMASSSKNSEGDQSIVFWDLNRQKIYSILQLPHNGRQISHLQFIANEPILISSSEDDNSLKMWFFEKGLTQPRLLKERCGHAEPPHKIRFYGGKDDPVNQGARNIISCSKDGQLRDISLLNEFQSMNFSKKNLTRSELNRDQGDDGFGAVTQFDFCEFRERDWQNVLTCQDRSKVPFLWSYANHSISKVPVENIYPKFRVSAVAVSQCGNFGILGYENGHLQKINLQSGKDRGTFINKLQGQTVHSQQVTGVGIDALNKIMITASLDCTIKQWDFFRRELMRSFSTEYPIENLVYNRLNDLIAFSSADISITIMNVKTNILKVREFKEVASNKITDLCFSQPDSKYIMCSSLDKSIKVWDILTGQLIDWIQFRNAPLSIDFSPSGEFLATSHIGSKAVYLWSNRQHFQNIIISGSPKQPIQIDLPTLSETENVKKSHKDFYNEDQKNLTNHIEEKGLIQLKFKELDEELKLVQNQRNQYLQLSNQPYSKWQAIYNLEQIKERNKPLLPKKELPKAPFFLFDLDKVLADNDATPDLLKEKLFSKQNKGDQTSQAKKDSESRKLKSILNQKPIKWNDVNDLFKSLSPSGIELEIISLATFDFDKSGSNPNQNLSSLMEFFIQQLRAKKDSDFIQSLVNCFIRIHYDILIEDEDLMNKVKTIMNESEKNHDELENLINHNICMISHFVDIQMH